MRKLVMLSACLALTGCEGRPFSDSASPPEPASSAQVASEPPTELTEAPAVPSQTIPSASKEAWNKCVYEEVRQREVLNKPKDTAKASASAVVEQCQRFYVGPAGFAEFFVYSTVSGLRAKTLTRPAPRPVVVDKRRIPRADVQM